MMLEHIDEGLFKRLQAASYALPVVEAFQDLADDVSGWTVDGISDKEIDKRIVAWLDDNGFGFDEWKAEMIADGFDAEKYGFDYQRDVEGLRRPRVGHRMRPKHRVHG